jgi:hypothetical protein
MAGRHVDARESDQMPVDAAVEMIDATPASDRIRLVFLAIAFAQGTYLDHR